MPDSDDPAAILAGIPEIAITTAVRALQAHPWPDGETTEAQAARVVLEAAAPLLAETLLTPLVKRHQPVASDWGGHYCGTCWNKDGSRPVWPCKEVLAISEFLPGDIPEVRGA